MLARPLMCGLCVTHLIASLQVWLSNQALLNKVSQINTLYDTLVIPTGAVLSSLADPAIAVMAALLFTLSIGLSLTCLSLGLMCVVRSHTNLLWILWGAVLIGINLPDWSLWLTLYLTAIPATVAITGRRYRSSLGVTEIRAWRAGGVAVLCSAGLSVALFNPSAGTFSQVRQHWLAPLPGGPALIDSYYHYSLYAAESIKTLTQKTTKTVRFTGAWPDAERKSMRARLVQHLYVPLHDAEGNADIHLHWQGSQVAVRCGNRTLPLLNEHAAGHQSKYPIRRWPNQCDTNQYLRTVMLGSFLLTPLLMVTLLVVTLLKSVPQLRKSGGAFMATSTVTTVLLVALLLHSLQPEPARSSTADPLPSQPIRSWLDRYHLIQRLSTRKDTVSGNALQEHTRDSSSYLAALAYRGLGNTGNNRFIPSLQSALSTSDNWFVQWEIYRALLRLGWRPDYSAVSHAPNNPN